MVLFSKFVAGIRIQIKNTHFWCCKNMLGYEFFKTGHEFKSGNNHNKEVIMFKLESKYTPSGDQPQAIEKLVKGIENGEKYQVLLGATGTGKTFTIANVIASVNKPTLVLAHNKTLAGQLYAELKELFPDNAVEYFVSYYSNTLKNPLFIMI